MYYRNLKQIVGEIVLNPNSNNTMEEEVCRKLVLILHNETSYNYFNIVTNASYFLTKNQPLSYLFNLFICAETIKSVDEKFYNEHFVECYDVFFDKRTFFSDYYEYLGRKKQRSIHELLSFYFYKWHSTIRSHSSDFKELYKLNYDSGWLPSMFKGENRKLSSKVRGVYDSIYRWEKLDKEELQKINILLDFVEEISSVRYTYSINSKTLDIACIPHKCLKDISEEQRNRIDNLLIELPFWENSFGYFWNAPQNKTFAKAVEEAY